MNGAYICKNQYITNWVPKNYNKITNSILNIKSKCFVFVMNNAFLINIQETADSL